jgi:hypothetical protein
MAVAQQGFSCHIPQGASEHERKTSINVEGLVSTSQHNCRMPVGLTGIKLP